MRIDAGDVLTEYQIMSIVLGPSLTEPFQECTPARGAFIMPWDFELLKTVLGFASIVGGTASGIAALLVEYKDDEGKITKWGRYALFGVGASFLIGASNLWLDYTQKKAESRETANKSRAAAE